VIFFSKKTNYLWLALFADAGNSNLQSQFDLVERKLKSLGNGDEALWYFYSGL
jgi:hypothetical protein